MKYRTVAGQTLDEITWRHYGDATGMTELVLEANPGLADYGPVLPSSLIVELPEYTPTKTVEGVKLWQ